MQRQPLVFLVSCFLVQSALNVRPAFYRVCAVFFYSFSIGERNMRANTFFNRQTVAIARF